MADVFLSYKRTERDEIEVIARYLRELELTVWFDASLTAGEAFNAEIDREARAARAVLVCWSPEARKSRWVNAEALIGFEHDKLAACYVSGPDHFDAPAPFNTVHATDLRRWLTSPDASDERWARIVGRVGNLCGRRDLADWGVLGEDAGSRDIERWISKHPESPLLIVAHTLAGARRRQKEERAQYEEEVRKEYAARAAAEKAESELLRREEEERRKREQGPIPTFFGSIFAVPIFHVVYVLVSVLAYIAIILFQMLGLDVRGGGLTYGAQLFAAGLSGYFGVQAGRAAIDFALKAWNGWPTFLIFASCWIATFYIPFGVLHYEPVLWPLILAGLQCLVSVGTTFIAIVRKETIS